jgi:hypothetical protein
MGGYHPGILNKLTTLLKMRFNKSYIFLGTIILCMFNSCEGNRSSFVFTETDQGIELSEGGAPVFFYQREPKSLDGTYVCNNYLHPLYSPAGDILTEEFPADHTYHRGVFWAWHQVFIDDQSVGNGWVMQDITHDVTGYRTRKDKKMATLELSVNWHSSIRGNDSPFIREQTSILIHPLNEDMRKIDFQISLEGLVPGVSLGGADDEKGYGGFCVRMKLPPDLAFRSVNGAVTPRNLQIESGPWMDFSGSFGENTGKSGLAILCHPSTPNYPASWILRQRTSMQNIVYPGRDRIELPVNRPVVLRYRTVLYAGDGSDIDFEQLQGEYDRFVYPNSGPQIRN